MLDDIEVNVLMTLGDAWSEFRLLERQHPEEAAEFRRAIHAAQVIVMARSAARERPALFSDAFLGVAMQRSTSGDTNPIRVATTGTTGTFEFISACNFAEEI